MRRTLGFTLLLATLAAPALAQSPDLVERYEHDRTALLDLVDGLTAEQWNYRTAPDRWSLAEIVEHIVLSEKQVWQVLTEQLEETEVTAEGRAQAEALEGQVAATLGDRTQRFEAPELVRPTGRWAGGDEVVGMFKEVRHAMLAWLGDADFDLRTRVAPHPILQTDVDAHAWALINVEHSARHQQQMIEVLEDPGFPGS